MLKLVHKYQADAEKCLDSGAYFAGLVSVRAALETLLLARFLLELFEWSEEELKEYGIAIEGEIIRVPEVKLVDLIEEAYKAKLLNKSGYEAAHRIRKWGNKIHCSQVAKGKKLPNISRRNLEARLKDLAIVSEQLLRTL